MDVSMPNPLPVGFESVHYVSSRIPGVASASDMSLGANCQLYAYQILKQHGLVLPDFRSSELWADTTYTEQVEQFLPLDIVLLNTVYESYGAHVGLFWGQDWVLHLSKQNGRPKIERLTDLLGQKAYRCLVGAKRVIPR